jgi:hypothetical protein
VNVREPRVISRQTFYPDRPLLWGALVAPLLRQFWMILLFVAVGALSSLAYGGMMPPLYEASAVVQTREAVSSRVAEERLTSRANLQAMVRRHLIASGQAADLAVVRLRQAVSIHELTGQAGGTLGFPPEVSGLVVSVLWPNAEVSARIANDLALQLLDEGNNGHLEPHHAELDFYRREERRLWQEISAFKAEHTSDQMNGIAEHSVYALAYQRKLALMEDQYAAARRHLADFALADRFSASVQAGQFSLLLRATSAEAVSVMRDWMLTGVAGSLLLAVALAFVLERRYPALQTGGWDEFAVANQRLVWLYRQFDDPGRPILGLPRILVMAGALAIILTAIAVAIR